MCVFLEEADLREKYAKKPEQLEAILRNTRPVYDPIRETTLYEDMKYVSGFEDNEEESKASGSAIIQEGRLKPKKAAKKEPKKPKIAKGEVAPDAQPGPHQISHAQASSLQKFLDIFTTMQYELAAGLQVIDDSKLQEYIAAATFQERHNFRVAVAGFHRDARVVFGNQDWLLQRDERYRSNSQSCRKGAREEHAVADQDGELVEGRAQGQGQEEEGRGLRRARLCAMMLQTCVCE